MFVKRVVGVPGDVWAEQNGKVLIDGKALQEPYIKFDRRDFETHTMKDIPGPDGRTRIYARIPKGSS